jgi:hypothetical protein
MSNSHIHYTLCLVNNGQFTILSNDIWISSHKIKGSHINQQNDHIPI